MLYVILTLGVLAIAAVWDGWRRHILARTYNQQTLDRIVTHERELERVNTQLQGVLGKLNAVAAANPNRMQRVVGTR